MMVDILSRLTSERHMRPEMVEMPYPSVPIESARVVFFDIYGTILLNTEGDIGNTMYRDKWKSERIERYFATACATACKEIFTCELSDDHFASFHRYYLQEIQNAHNASRARGITVPEIDIRDIWRAILIERQKSIGITRASITEERVAEFAIMIELLTNPVQLAPNIIDTLALLKRKGVILGIISNAQFYTPLIIEHFARASLESIGFNPALCYWSYEKQVAKPAISCFKESVASAMRLTGAPVHEMLYIGNDLRNDIIPAKTVGMRTCLYCGDKRSVRLYPDQAKIKGERSDTWITNYRDLPGLLV